MLIPGKAMNVSSLGPFQQYILATQALCLPPSGFSMAAIWWSNLSPATAVCYDDRRGVNGK